MAFSRLCQPRNARKEVAYKCTNHYRREAANLYFFSDVPHLLKTSRNCFSNSFAHLKSRTLKV